MVKRISKKDIDGDINSFISARREFSESSLLGGSVSYPVSSEDVALDILERFGNHIAFWQISRDYFVVVPGRKARIRSEGFSRQYFPNQISRTWLRRAIKDTATQAANNVGFDFKYEGRTPSLVKPITARAFTLIVWYVAETREVFS